MLKAVEMFTDCILLSSFWFLPLTLARSVTEYVAHPFTTKNLTTTTVCREKVLLASHSTAKVSYDLEASSIVPNFLQSHNSDSAAFTSEETVESYHDLGLVEENDLEEAHDLNLPQEFDNQHVLYRYFAKARSRLRNQDSIPFIFLGPSVDHWQIVGQTLATRGFSVMACERDVVEDGDCLVRAILESLRWNRAILVGCDREAVMAIKAALALSPDRVAGLILCGDLRDVQAMIGTENLDDFLERNIDCPFSVIWDGDGSYSVNQHRCLIRGGGSAPHRRLPEQFAWALTRFVEERVAPLRGGAIGTTRDTAGTGTNLLLRRFRFLEKLFTPGGWLVTGRVLAEGVFYVSALKVVLYQYENIYDGVSRIRAGYRSLSTWPRRFFKLLAQTAFVWKGNNDQLLTRINDEVPATVSEEGPREEVPREEAPREEAPREEFAESLEEDEQVPPLAESLEADEQVPPLAEQGPDQEAFSWPLPLLNPVLV